MRRRIWNRWSFRKRVYICNPRDSLDVTPPRRGRVAKLNENHPVPERAKATKVGAALGLLHLGLSLLEWENDGVWKVRWQLSDPCGRDFLATPFYQTSPSARRKTKDRRMGAEFWEIERLNENTSAPEGAEAN